MLFILFSLAIAYLPNNLNITSVKNLFLPVPCSPMIIIAVSVREPGFEVNKISNLVCNNIIHCYDQI
jgi:hypothetical protein